MNVVETTLPGVVILEPKAFGDSRGFFLESFNKERHAGAGLNVEFVQDNHSRSQARVLRGLHFQRGQGKLVSVVRGAIFDVAVDIRPDSPNFGQWTSAELNDENHHQLYIPPGFAHGFAVLSEMADVLYKTTDYYKPELEGGFAWNDPDVDVEWPLDDPILSDRDQKSPQLKEIPADQLTTLAQLRDMGRENG